MHVFLKGNKINLISNFDALSSKFFFYFSIIQGPVSPHFWYKHFLEHRFPTLDFHQAAHCRDSNSAGL